MMRRRARIETSDHKVPSGATGLRHGFSAPREMMGCDISAPAPSATTGEANKQHCVAPTRRGGCTRVDWSGRRARCHWVVLVGTARGFPGWWQGILESVGTCITLVMVFAIQHTQSWHQSATQRKLDELLRAMPSADDRLIAVEEAPDEELQALADPNLADREAATHVDPAAR
jgi:low affinity Fe/Cu permease